METNIQLSSLIKMLESESNIVNASKMADIYDANIFNFLAEDETKETVKEFCKKFSKPLKKEFTKKGSGVKVISPERILMHKYVAIRFAGWLDPSVFDWAYSNVPGFKAITENFLKDIGVELK
ncbi:MAG: KilA-N domain-containing protein [Tannerellaceae bacterium]|nr:KilA-N domain-containing protein [Tannerellaceae bacterium]